MVFFSAGAISIVTGDNNGYTKAFNVYSDLWELRLSDMKPKKVDL